MLGGHPLGELTDRSGLGGPGRQVREVDLGCIGGIEKATMLPSVSESAAGRWQERETRPAGGAE